MHACITTQLGAARQGDGQVRGSAGRFPVSHAVLIRLAAAPTRADPVPPRTDLRATHFRAPALPSHPRPSHPPSHQRTVTSPGVTAPSPPSHRSRPLRYASPSRSSRHGAQSAVFGRGDNRSRFQRRFRAPLRAESAPTPCGITRPLPASPPRIKPPRRFYQTGAISVAQPWRESGARQNAPKRLKIAKSACKKPASPRTSRCITAPARSEQ